MAALIRAAALALALAAPGVATPEAAAPGEPQDAFSASPAVARWRPWIAEAARWFAIPEAWIAAVMQAESAGLTTLDGRPITSRAGAIGVMQLMPDTYAAMRRRHGLGTDPYDPHDNILAGAAYLRAMYDRFGYPGLFAAYNAGPARYADHLATGRPLPGETQAYIASLARAPAAPAMPPAVLSGMRLFFTLGGAAKPVQPSSEPSPPAPPAGTLFVPLTIEPPSARQP